MRFTKKSIDGLTTDRRQEYFWEDSDDIRFGVCVYRSGRKVYVLDYRTEAGRRRRMNISPVEAMPPTDARALARRLAAEIAGGNDPLKARKDEKRHSMTLGQLWEAYAADVLEGGRPEIRKGRPPLRPSTVRAYRQTWDLWIGPKLGKRKLDTIDRRTLERFHDRMRDKPTAANRCLAALSILFSYAQRRGLADRNPVTGISHYRENRRQRFLDGAELARLAEVLAVAENGGGTIQRDDQTIEVVGETWQTVAAVRLALLTGMRLGELTGLRWEHIDREAGLIRIPHAKGHARDLALTPPVLDILDSLPREQGTPYVLAGFRSGRPFQGLGKCWRRIRTAAGIEDVRWHDLRHSSASMAVSTGIGLDMIQVILGHRQRSTSERYAHAWPDPARVAAETLAKRMAEALAVPTGETETAEVIEHPNARS